jgi:predicted ribosomally synthesized peptide with nif11-like leader
MSMEAATSFYERLEQEPELTERIRELSTQDRIESYVKGELGYDFTREEIQKVIFGRNPEMTDEEMEAVVGGLDGTSILVGAGLGLGAGLGVATVLVAASAGAAA